VGSAAGLALGYTAIRVTSSRYLALPSLDFGTLMLMPVLLTAIILFACYFPARAAGRFEPLNVLRRL
jgi:ABC-type lipoprotein release transport system permease subunit